MEDKENAGINPKDVKDLANRLLQKCNVDFVVESVSECNTELFLALFHAILGDFPPGALVENTAYEAKVHNIRCIIETLSEDYLHVELSHIDPIEVVNSELATVFNLLEILEGFLDYLLEQISLDLDTDDEREVDSDHLSTEAQNMAMETLRKEMYESLKERESSEHQSKDSLADTDELIALGEEPGDEFVPLTPSTASSYAQWHDLSTVDEISEHALSEHSLATSENTTITNEEQLSSDLKHAEKNLQKLEKSLQKLSIDKPNVEIFNENFSHIPKTFSKENQLTKIDKSDEKINHLEHYEQLKGSISDEKSDTDCSSSVKSVILEAGSSLRHVAESISDGGSLSSNEQRARLDVILDDKSSDFVMQQRKTPSISNSSEPIDVADGKVSDGDNLRPPSREDAKQKDWKLLLNSLQKTVDESKKIREKYFSASLNESREYAESEQFESSFASDDVSSVLCETYPQPQRQKNVRFEDTISTKTAKDLARFREELRKERKLQETKNKILSTNFRQHLEEVEESEKEKLSSLRNRVEDASKEIKTSQAKQMRKKSKPVKRLAGVAKRRPWQKHEGKIPSGQKITKRIPSTLCIDEHDLLPQLLEQFPHLEISPTTLNDLWTKQFRQIEHLTSAAIGHKHKIRQKEKQLTDGHIKHAVLIGILQKQHEHTKRVKEMRIKNAQQKEAQRVVKDRRLQTARIRRYYRDYHQQMKSRMLRRRTKEEKIFKHLFEEGLAIQKSRLRELRRYASDKREEMNNQQRNEIASLENYYKDQFAMLAETLADEKNQLQIKDKAQTKLLRQMKRGLQNKMEKEISNLQELIARDDEDAYYREVEADRVRRQLQLATYNSKVAD